MGRNSFQMFKVKKAFEHGHQVLLVALLNRNALGRRQNFSKSKVSPEEEEGSLPEVNGNEDVSILAHLIRSDDEMLLNRFEEKKELLREWEAMQRRKKHHLQGRGEDRNGGKSEERGEDRQTKKQRLEGGK